jgi:hypothetical protein
MSLFCNKKIGKESGITAQYELLRVAFQMTPRAKTKYSSEVNMWSPYQRKLLTELCQFAQLELSLQVILEHGTLLWRDIPVTLLPTKDDAESLSIYVHYGVPPKENNAAILTRLLEINLLMPQTYFERIGIDPESGAVIFQYRIKALSPEKILHLIQHAASKASEWRDDYFLHEESI